MPSVGRWVSKSATAAAIASSLIAAPTPACLSKVAIGAPIAAAASDVKAPEAPPTDAKKLLDKVQARYAKIDGIHARFHQELTSATLGQTDVADGECWFAKPGKMRWAYTSPVTQLMVSDGAMLWFYEPDKGQVTKTALDPEMLKQVPTGFLNGTGSLSEGYRAELPKLELPPQDGIAVDLTPEKAAPFQKLRVVVEPTTNLVTEITIFDPFGNVNRLTFTEIEPGKAREAAFFQFTTPEGVREIAPPNPGGAPTLTP